MRTKKWFATIAVMATATCGVWLGLSSAPAGAQAVSATAVTSNVASISTGGTLTFMATVTSAGVPVGTVGSVAWTGVACTTTTALTTAGVATCSITNAQASVVYTATADYTDSTLIFDPSSGSLGPVSPSLGTQAALSITSTSGTFSTPLTLTTAGGTGGGAVTYVAAAGTASGCAISSGAPFSLTSTSAGTCIVTATKAADPNYNLTTSPATTITVAKAAQPTPPTITNLPSQGTYGGGFTAIVGNTIGDGVTSVASLSTTVCKTSGLAVSYVGPGTCSLTAQIEPSTNYLGATGSAQSFSVGRAQASTPTITNLPTGAVEFAGFTANIGTTGDGTMSVVSSTPGICKVESDGQTVLFITTGACTLTPSVATGTNYLGATGSPRTFQIGPAPRGYWLVGSDGGIFSFGAAAFHGSMGGVALQRPVVGITPTLTRGGYWLVASDGGIFSFGDARFFGSIPGTGLNPAGSGLPHSLAAPIVGMVPSVNRRGYFMVASDGGVFAFGDAKFEGSCPGIGSCSGRAVAVMPDGTGNGYWLVTNTGGVYSFGDAPFYGAPGTQSSPVVNAAATPDGMGYWLLFANGVVASYGDATNFGSPTGYVNTYNPANAIFPTADGKGYWVASTRGDVFAYGNAPYLGSMAGTALNGAIIAAFGF